MHTRRVTLIVSTGLLAAAALGSEPRPTPAGSERHEGLSGSASLGRNLPVVGATVLARPLGGAAVVFVTVTDGKGRFRIDALPEGEYRVEISRPGLRTVVKQPVAVHPPSRAVVEVLMERAGATAEAHAPDPTDVGGSAMVRGSVLDRGGKPLAEVALRFARLDGGVDPVIVQSAADGSFDSGTLPAGAWRLDTRVVGYLPVHVALDIAHDTELGLVLGEQPAGYLPSPLELMPPEEPIPPARFRAPREPARPGG